MSVLYAALSALAYGAGDYAGGRATRALNVLGVLFISQAVGLVGIAAAAVALRQPLPADSSAVWGAAAGLSGLIGLGSLYRGLSEGSAAIVSPVAAVVGAGAPIIAGVLLGDSPTLTGWLGIAVALPAILLLSLSRGRSAGFETRSLLFAAVAGIGFGGYFILIDQSSNDSGLWPLVAARTASIIVIVVIALVRARLRGPLVRDSASRGTAAAVIAGGLDMAANVFFLLAIRTGLLVTSSVVSSLYPAPTVVLSRVLDGQELGSRRIVGLVLALAGVGLMAA